MAKSDAGGGDAHECGECASVAFGDPESACCGESMTPVDSESVVSPDLAMALRDVFGISETGLNVCLCLMEAGESTAGDVADQLGIDRSTVTRQLNHLTDVGVLDKRQRLLEGGGYVNVYSPVPVEEVRERLTAGLFAWTDEALDLVEHVNREKLDALARADDERDADGAEGGDGRARGDAGDGSADIYWDG
ncbi:TrmB family transcriptional regulator [Halobacteriales archaeon SW_6_65_15]|nr:MAG: TrmB family transcriptional regulator [Halobacteriales archaeon SW_6_65_15]